MWRGVVLPLPRKVCTQMHCTAHLDVQHAYQPCESRLQLSPKWTSIGEQRGAVPKRSRAHADDFAPERIEIPVTMLLSIAKTAEWNSGVRRPMCADRGLAPGAFHFQSADEVNIGSCTFNGWEAWNAVTRACTCKYVLC